MTPAQAARLLAYERHREQEAAAEAGRAAIADGVVLVGATPPGWLARKIGRLYAEPLQDVRDQIALSIDRVEFQDLPRARRRWAVARFVEWRQAARARLSDLSRYGAVLGPDNILQFTRK